MAYDSPSSITPGRTTSVIFDLTETALLENAFSVTRGGAEIARDVAVGLGDNTPDAPDARHANIKVWASGAITLKPLQQDISNVHEGVVCAPYIIRASGLTLIQTLQAAAQNAIVEQMQYNTADLPGFSVSSNIQPTGDPWLVKQVVAGATWDNALTDSVPTPEIVTQDIPMDRVGYSNSAYPANQGFFIQWIVPGGSVAVNGYTWAFYFGQYAVCIQGTGRAELWEYCTNTNLGSQQWRRRAGWQYARAGQLTYARQAMAIWPHTTPDGARYIAFTNGQLEVAGVVSQTNRTDATASAPGDFTYRVDEVTRNSYEQDMSPGYATAPGIVRFDIRRDIRLKVQMSTLAWPTSGFVVDLPSALPPLTSDGTALTCYTASLQPSGTSLSTSLLDARTGNAFVLGTSGGPQVRFDLSGDGTDTPVLWEYRLVRPAVTGTSAPGSFTAKAIRYSLAGRTGDATHDSAQITIQDTAGALTRLRTRGRFAFAVVVTDSVGQVVLFRGYAMRPTGTKKGTAGRTYPSPNWNLFDVPGAGMWQRLSEKYAGPMIRQFAHDGNAPSGPNGEAPPPFKATDVITELLASCGYPPSQINIADNPTRLYPGETVKLDDLVLDAAANISDYIQRLCRDYLGAYLIFEPNAGTPDANGLPCGQWMLLFQTPFPEGGSYTPLVNFVTSPAVATVPPQLPGAYPAGVCPIFGRVETTPIPIEFNHVVVTTSLSLADTTTQGRVEAHAYNYNSYKVPGSTVTPDPNGADYLGHERILVYPDASLASDGPDAVAQTQAACNFVCRRIFDVACHGQIIKHFTAPLIFITDAAGGYRRPLRFQDAVAVNGDATYLVKSVTINYAKDGFQLAEYEVIQPVGGQYVPPGIGSLDFFRQANDQAARRTSGMGTQSGRYARRGVPPGREQSVLEQPCILTAQTPLQSPSGAFNESLFPGYFPAG